MGERGRKKERGRKREREKERERVMERENQISIEMVKRERWEQRWMGLMLLGLKKGRNVES